MLSWSGVKKASVRRPALRAAGSGGLCLSPAAGPAHSEGLETLSPVAPQPRHSASGPQLDLCGSSKNPDGLVSIPQLRPRSSLCWYVVVMGETAKTGGHGGFS